MLPKYSHEIRDPIHVFIRLNSDERRVLDSPQFQRLRHIHQLAMSYLVYPGATHKRFEHALGTMELATKVFDVVTHPDNVRDQIRSLMPEISSPKDLMHWRCVLRMAALFHDIGHLPFSHAAEHELLPAGWDHERITVEIIKSEEMREIWIRMTPPLRAEDIAKIAVGRKINIDEHYTDWENILSEIIVGDAFGVDRMDYLLRDSLHTGVAYGRFDHHRLLDTIRILPPVPLPGETSDASKDPAIGVEEGGIHSAQALLLARYFMYSQVYFHPIRVIYDNHLIDFLSEWLPGGKFPVKPNELMKYTDTEVLNAISIASKAPSESGHYAAKRVVERKHFKRVYSLRQTDKEIYLHPGLAIRNALREEFGCNNVYHKAYTERVKSFDLSMLGSDGRITSEFAILESIPSIAYDFVFVAPEQEEKAAEWLDANREDILNKASQSQQEDDEEHDT